MNIVMLRIYMNIQSMYLILIHVHVYLVSYTCSSWTNAPKEFEVLVLQIVWEHLANYSIGLT